MVLFNIPVVPLTNLSERDKLPCPLAITPKIEGKCQWTNGNILEFIPNKPLELATKYHLKVSDTLGLLYPLTNTLEDDIITPELSVSTEVNTFDPHQMIIRTSAPVDLTELAKNLTLTDVKMGTGTNMGVQIENVKYADKTMSEMEFLITSKSGPLLYSHNYGVSVKRGLKPKYGTEPLAKDFQVVARSADFLSSSQVFRKIYDSSGTLSDTSEYDSSHPIPSQNVLFRQTFMAEVGLDKNLFTLRTATGLIMDFNLAYVKQDKYDERGNKTGVEENKHMVDLAPMNNLEEGTAYEFIVNKKANTSLPADTVKTYKTAPKFQIL